jgi:drug/metabolite transporter (DMT)-like permease
MQQPLKNWGLLFLLSLIWGSSFILMKRGMESLDGHLIFSDAQVASLRMTIAGLVMLPIGLYHLKKVTSWKVFFGLAGVGFFGNFFPAFLFTFAEKGLSSGYTGMLNTFTPVFTIIFGLVFFKSSLNRLQGIGLLISILGVVLLINTGAQQVGSFDNSSLPYAFAVVGATICYALSLNFMKYMIPHIKSIHATALAFTFTLGPALFIFWKTGVPETISINEYAKEGLFFISILALVGTAFAVVLYNRLTIQSTTLFASSVTYLIPIVAVFIGSFFGESIHVMQVVSMGLVLIGVFVANGRIDRWIKNGRGI